MRKKEGKGVMSGRWLRPLLMALLVQIGGAFLAGIVVVWVIEDNPEEEPVLPITIDREESPPLSPTPPQYDVGASVWQQAAVENLVMERIQMDMLATMNLPTLPTLPNATEDPSELLQDRTLEGLSKEMQSLLSAGASSGVASFFGVEESGKRILILFDISQTVVNKSRAVGVPMSRIRDETIRLIEGLDIHTQFGLIQFSRVYETFQDVLIPATRGNKEVAIRWMQESFAEDAGVIPGKRGVRDYPRGIETVLRVAFQMHPDAIFLLSDGAFWRSLDARRQEVVPYSDIERMVAAWKSQASKPVRLHFIGFQMHEKNRSSMRRIVDLTGGTLREMGK
jgi:hypothetical protein